MTTENEKFKEWYRSTFIRVSGGLRTYSTQNEIEKEATKIGFIAGYKSQQAEITRLNAIIALQDETIKIMEDLINSEPRTFDKDIWESLSDKSIKLAMNKPHSDGI